LYTWPHARYPRGTAQSPTLTDVPLDADLFNEEPFGPIVGIRGLSKKVRNP
jgi:acyl-CoA reductase-like NAD-dependent aldehyde dehydrogenase